METRILGITIDRHLSVSSLVMGVTAIISVSVAWANVQRDVIELRREDARLEKVMEVQKVDHNRQLDRILEAIERVNDKLDKKADKS